MSLFKMTAVLMKRKHEDDLNHESDSWDWHRPNQYWCGDRVAFQNGKVDVISLAALIHNSKRDKLFRQAIGKQFWSFPKNQPQKYAGFVDTENALDTIQKAVEKTKFKDEFADKLKDFKVSDDWKSIQAAPEKRRQEQETQRMKTLDEKQTQHLEEVKQAFKKARKAFTDWRNFRATVDPKDIPDICICGLASFGHADCVKSYFDH